VRGHGFRRETAVYDGEATSRLPVRITPVPHMDHGDGSRPFLDFIDHAHVPQPQAPMALGPHQLARGVRERVFSKFFRCLNDPWDLMRIQPPEVAVGRRLPAHLIRGHRASGGRPALGERWWVPRVARQSRQDRAGPPPSVGSERQAPPQRSSARVHPPGTVPLSRPSPRLYGAAEGEPHHRSPLTFYSSPPGGGRGEVRGAPSFPLPR